MAPIALDAFSPSANATIALFIQHLSDVGFDGDVEQTLPQRMVAAVDNSIYRLLPAAVLFPKTQAAVQVAIQAARIFGVPIIARGGATGTNGQSLGTGVVLDLSRHMNRVLELDATNGVVRVEAGVVLDQLNSALIPNGLFFAPTVSTSSRATIGGMFATDASGKGSRKYGRTSDHVLSIECVTADGMLRKFDDRLKDLDKWQLGVVHQLESLLAEHAEEIESVFPDINRGLTGYNLRDVKKADSGVNMLKLLSGSEGTLAITTGLTLNLCKIPTHQTLVVIGYQDSLSALDHVSDLLSSEPLAIEFVDERIIENARQTPLWSDVASLFGELSESRGFLFVEFAGFAQAQIDAAVQNLENLLRVSRSRFENYTISSSDLEISQIWEIRKLAVGLIARSTNGSAGVPFVEDAAVPPERLSAFVEKFSALLEQHGLSYGMYGHADVGCVHVRPMLDMRNPQDRDRVRPLSDQVSALCRQFGGLIWGEHGKGVRSEYVREYVGEDLYQVMAEVKRIFDPSNLLNPGKIVGPDGKFDEIYKIDTTPFRGARDAQIDDAQVLKYSKAIGCNGNGACHNWSPNTPMCPSYKATRDRSKSPQGRATLLREYSRLKSLGRDDAEIREIERALFESLSVCLSCKSCTGQCPIQINIPEMKSHFLNEYYARHRRPVRDIVIRQLETASIAASKFPRLANACLNGPGVRQLLSRVFKLIDLPEFACPPTLQRFQSQGLDIVENASQLESGSICLLSDSFLAPFDPGVITDAASLLQKMGLKVAATKILPLGKALDVRGFADQRDRVIQKASSFFDEACTRNVTLVVLEPAVYHDLLDLHKAGALNASTVMPIEQLLLQQRSRALSTNNSDIFNVEEPFWLIPHCTEKSKGPESANSWIAIYEAFGLQLHLHEAGCCGMAGMFGHEAENKDLSKKIFDMSWSDPAMRFGDRLLSTGFSCRGQVRRFAASPPKHPVQMLNRLVNQ